MNRHIFAGIIGVILIGAVPAAALSVDAAAGLGVSAGGSGNGVSAEVGADASSSREAGQGNVQLTTTTNAGGEHTISVDAAGAAIEANLRSAARVSTDADVQAYGQEVAQRDTDVGTVESSSDSVIVSHREKARFFGIFPITVLATATIRGDGSVNVSYPWYVFAFGQASALEGRIAAAVKQHAALSASAGASAPFDAATKARIIGTTAATMKAAFDAEAEASAR